MKKQTPEEFQQYLKEYWEKKEADKIAYALENLTTMDFEDFIIANKDKQLKGVKFFFNGEFSVSPSPELEEAFIRWYVNKRIDATELEKEEFFKKMELKRNESN